MSDSSLIVSIPVCHALHALGALFCFANALYSIFLVYTGTKYCCLEDRSTKSPVVRSYVNVIFLLRWTILFSSLALGTYSALGAYYTCFDEGQGISILFSISFGLSHLFFGAMLSLWIRLLSNFSVFLQKISVGLEFITWMIAGLVGVLYPFIYQLARTTPAIWVLFTLVAALYINFFFLSIILFSYLCGRHNVPVSGAKAQLRSALYKVAFLASSVLLYSSVAIYSLSLFFAGKREEAVAQWPVILFVGTVIGQVIFTVTLAIFPIEPPTRSTSPAVKMVRIPQSKYTPFSDEISNSTSSSSST